MVSSTLKDMSYFIYELSGVELFWKIDKQGGQQGGGGGGVGKIKILSNWL